MFQQEETGIEPTRAEIFIASRMKLDGSMICEEARICAVSSLFLYYCVFCISLCAFLISSNKRDSQEVI